MIKKILLSTLLLVAFHALRAQIDIYASQSVGQQKIGYYQNQAVFSTKDKQRHEAVASTQHGTDGRLEILTPDGSVIGYIEWNSTPQGASSIIDKNGKHLGFVSAVTGNLTLYSVSAGKAKIAGFATTGILTPDAPEFQLAAAAAAFLLFFDWC